MAKSTGISQNLRGYDSWIDISSQPSSPSESPVTSEIVTTGLRVQHPTQTRRRRKVVSEPPFVTNEICCTSSQEDYEVSESDEDHTLAGSDENIVYSSLAALSSYEVDSDSDREEVAKTYSIGGKETRASLDTQLDPSSQQSSNICHDSTGSQVSFSPVHAKYPHIARNVFQQQFYCRPADHDAALRASLNTLLSIGAAAARGLPKRESPLGRDFTPSRSQENKEPIGIRFVSESELMSPSSHQPSTPAMRPTNVNTASHNLFSENRKLKRSATKNTDAAKEGRLISQQSMISPTFLTWAVSAGVLVVISVFGFGAGYIIGKDVGRQETLAGLNSSIVSNDSTCGREAIGSTSSGFKNFKWGIGRGSRSVIT